ncbi:mechanosensitive ion channel family protein [Candidatus Woesearchaeota archaeon]|nr:mechanosensitive ion channel family protein [Candidatus Woesearchaeota archaeon]
MIQLVETLLTTEVHGNMVQDYLVALLIMTLIFLGLTLISYLFKKILKKIDKKNPEKQLFFLKIMEAFTWPLFLVIGLSIASVSLERTEIVSKILRYALAIIITVYITKIVIKIINYVSSKLIERNKDENGKDPAAIEISAKLLSIAAWIIAIIAILTMFQVNLGTIITGLGLASVAIAFALQNVLSDVFASISIYFDKPFGKGDFISTGTDMGFVQKIGIKSTRIKTLNGEELIISNRELTESRVRNFRHMEKRRVALEVGVQYDTPVEKLQKIPKIIEKILNKIESAELSRAHFKTFTDSNMQFEAIYFIKNKNYQLYMDTQQTVNLELVKAFRKEGIQFAFPTRTIHMYQEKKKKKK